MLKVLYNIKDGLNWKEKASILLGYKSYHYMMFNGNFTRKDITNTLQSLVEKKELKDQRLGWLHNQFVIYLNQLDNISSFLDWIESEDIITEALEKAKRYLPKSANIEADVHLVIGGSDAYGVNLLDTRAIVMNVGSFNHNLEELIAIMAHELHHKAENRIREIYWRLHRNGPKNLERIFNIISELIGEGIATLVTFPYGFANKYSLVKKTIDCEYKIVEDGIMESYQNISNERGEQIFSSLYNHARA